MTLKEHIKNQKEKCLKCEVNTREYVEHWDLMNYLIEVERLRKENKRMIDLLVKKGILRELYE